MEIVYESLANQIDSSSLRILGNFNSYVPGSRRCWMAGDSGGLREVVGGVGAVEGGAR